MRRPARPAPPEVELSGGDAALLAAIRRADLAAVAAYDRLDPVEAFRAAGVTALRQLAGRARLVLRAARRLVRR